MDMLLMHRCEINDMLNLQNVASKGMQFVSLEI
jgi:hypothetical protein